MTKIAHLESHFTPEQLKSRYLFSEDREGSIERGIRRNKSNFSQKLPERVKELQQKHPDATIEVWAFDEHRVGLKPIIRRIWAPIGERPIGSEEHRYEWLYLYSFVHAKTGETEWYLIPRVNVQWFNLVLKAPRYAVPPAAPPPLEPEKTRLC